MDQAGPPAAADVGGTVSFDGTRLTRSGFVGHRRMVEREHPLELDLLSLGLDLLPECLQRWLTAKVRTSTRSSVEGEVRGGLRLLWRANPGSSALAMRFLVAVL